MADGREKFDAEPYKRSDLADSGFIWYWIRLDLIKGAMLKVCALLSSILVLHKKNLPGQIKPCGRPTLDCGLHFGTPRFGVSVSIRNV